MKAKRTALVVDLNNFARYPTIAVGYLAAALKSNGYEVKLLSPLASRLPTVPERRWGWWQYTQSRVFFSTHPATVRAHGVLASGRRRWVTRADSRLTHAASRTIDTLRPDIVLLSAYLDYGAAVREIAQVAASRRIPILLGGPGFNLPEVAATWLDTPGLTALVAAEVDHSLGDIVGAALNGGDLSTFPGVYLPDGRRGPVAFPLDNLDRLPIPDLSEFPWHLYPNRIVPVMTGRGCGWGACTFCSDVKVVNGLSFRSRPVESVLDELEHQGTRYGTKDVIFLDIKLNTSLGMWRGIIRGFQDRLPGGRWIGTVHVQASGENGLTREELAAAAEAGLTRMSFGLETGSQRMNNVMAKGTSIERTAQFLSDAHDAGISVRATAILGYPGETADDIDQTTRFLNANRQFLDRIQMTRFTPIPGTRFHELFDRSPERFPGVTHLEFDYRLRRGEYRYAPASTPAYRKAKSRLLHVVYAINRRPLGSGPHVFDGLM